MYRIMLAYRLYFLLLVVTLTPSITHGQEEDDGTDFIESIRAVNNVRTGLNARDYRIRFFTNSEKTLEFRNSGINATIGARLGIINLTFSLPLARVGSLVDTDAQQTAFNLDLYQKWGYVGITLQRVLGFEEQDILMNNTDFRADVKMTQVGVYGFRVLNDRFSLRAAFKNAERQLRSQGSLVLAGTLEVQAMRSDGLRLRLRDGTDVSAADFDQQKIGLGIGYGHTWSTIEGWYLTPLLVAGFELRHNQYSGTQTMDIQRFRISPRIRGRLAFGYNGERLFASVRGSFLPGYEVGERLNTRTRNSRIALVMGWRFNKHSSTPKKLL